MNQYDMMFQLSRDDINKYYTIIFKSSLIVLKYKNIKPWDYKEWFRLAV